MTRAQEQTWYLGFFEFFKLRQVLIPFSTCRFLFTVGNNEFIYTDMFVFGFRIIRIHVDKD